MCSLCLHVLAIDIVFNFFIIVTIQDVMLAVYTYKKQKQALIETIMFQIQFIKCTMCCLAAHSCVMHKVLVFKPLE